MSSSTSSTGTCDDGAAYRRLRDHAVTCGFAGMGDDELLALLIGARGSLDPIALARQLLGREGVLSLAGCPTSRLRKLGVPPAATVAIAAAFDLVRRVGSAQRAQRPPLRSPSDIAAAVGAEMAALPVEELWLLPLDSQSRLIGTVQVITRGDVDGTDAGPRAVFRAALQVGAVSAVVVHNHPGGTATPSTADQAVTSRLVAAGRVVDVQLVDHVVIGSARDFVSIRAMAPDLWR